METEEEDDLSKAALMASHQDRVYKEITMEGMGHFTAYSNKAVKVVFEDRTLVRMMQGCDVIRILNKKGEEYFFNISKPNLLFNEYKNYVKVAEEFFEWVFLSKEDRESKE